MSQNFIVLRRGESNSLRSIAVIPQSSTPIPGYSFLVEIPLPYRQGANGFHAGNELERVYDIEEKLIEMLESPNYIFVGHISRPGVTTIYFYSRIQPPKELTVKYKFLKKAVVSIECRPDSEWLFYKHELEPTKLEFHSFRNQGLHDVFEKQGDNPDLPRPVDFGCFFPSNESRIAFLSEAANLGFNLSSAGTWGGPDHPEEPQDDYWCELVKSTSIQPDTIAQICVDLDDLCEKHNGEFDGWACPVAK